MDKNFNTGEQWKNVYNSDVFFTGCRLDAINDKSNNCMIIKMRLIFFLVSLTTKVRLAMTKGFTVMH